MFAVLNGSFIFMADLLRRIPLQLQVDCLSVSSYHGTSTGRINFRQTQFTGIRGRHVLILDDILDSGMTLHTVRQRLAAESGALSPKVCVLLRKSVSRERQPRGGLRRLRHSNEFVVGYGWTTTNDIAIFLSSVCSPMRRFGGTHWHLRRRRPLGLTQRKTRTIEIKQRRAEPKDDAQTELVPGQRSGQIIDFRRRPKRNRMDVSGAGNDFLDRLTLIGLENNSIASERTLQIAGTHRREYRRAHRQHQSGARKLAHEDDSTHEA